MRTTLMPAHYSYSPRLRGRCQVMAYATHASVHASYYGNRWARSFSTNALRILHVSRTDRRRTTVRRPWRAVCWRYLGDKSNPAWWLFTAHYPTVSYSHAEWMNYVPGIVSWVGRLGDGSVRVEGSYSTCSPGDATALQTVRQLVEAF